MKKIGLVGIYFPGAYNALHENVPEGFELARTIIEDILPCQLEILYFFHFCTWGETMRYGLTWGDLGAMTWRGWRHYYEGSPDPAM